MSYLIIFSLKTVENILTTFRIIVISNQKKLLGAILNLITALIWIYSTILVIKDINKDLLNIIAFSLGCFFGSYIGSIIEEKIALGDSMITCITELNSKISLKLRELGYQVTTIDGFGYKDRKKILLIIIPRKKQYRVSKLIKLMDESATVVSENASYFKT